MTTCFRVLTAASSLDSSINGHSKCCVEHTLVLQATVCAKFGLECIVYMGAKDMVRQKLNVFRMRLLGAEVRPVRSGTATLKDATSEAIRDWVTNVETTHYILGSAAGPHPYPMMVRHPALLCGGYHVCSHEVSCQFPYSKILAETASECK